MGKFAAVVAASVAATAAANNMTELADQFAAFKARFGKAYESGDEDYARMMIFNDNMKKAQALNDVYGPQVKFGTTKFSDLTADEFKAYLNYQPSGMGLRGTVLESNATAPTDYDWRDQANVVSAVKDQGQCGSCWAYSATEAIESQNVLIGNPVEVFSPQQIISCDKVDLGCDGGDTITAYQYVEKAGGLATEADYPDTSADSGETGKCKGRFTITGGKVTGYTYATPGCTSGACNKQDEDTMVTNVVSTGPASICVNAENWQLYDSGVMTGTACGGHAADDLDHCVQVVGYQGYTSDSKSTYWIVRNSWNTDWGVEGYIYVELGVNACGIANEATFPTIAPASRVH